MATNQNKPLQTAAVLPEPKDHTQKREEYEYSLYYLTVLEEELKNTTEEEKLKELDKAIKKEKQNISKQKSSYKKEIENRMQKLEKCSDSASQCTLEVLKIEMEEMQQVDPRLRRFNLQNELQQLKDKIAELEGTQDTNLKIRLSSYKYRKNCIEGENTAKGALEKLQTELDSIVKEKKINPEKRQEVEKKVDKDLAEAQKILDDLSNFIKQSDVLKGHLAVIEKEKGKEAIPKTPEDLWKVLSEFEGFQTTIIGEKTKVAIKAKERQHSALAIQKGLKKLTELEVQILKARKRYEDAIDKRKKALGQNRVGAHKRKVVDEDKSDH